MRLVIIGGVAGGATAATRARRLSEQTEILLFERGYYVSYANCGLPYYIGGEIEKRDDLFIASPDRLANRYQIDVRRCQEVIEIDRKNKEIVINDLETGKIKKEFYDILILSPGSKPVRPDIKGIDADRIFTLKDLPDADHIKAFLDEKKVASALIMGAGFIGLEAAENFSRHGVKIIMVEKLNQVLSSLDFEMAAIVHEHLRDQEVELILNRSVISFETDGNHVVATLESGHEITADMVLIAAGISPEKILADTANLAIGTLGNIRVDDTFRTSDPFIYAIGDVIEVPDAITGENRIIPLAGPANRQGRAAADNALGRKSLLGGFLGTTITRVFDKVAASTGYNEKKLKKAGLPYQISFTHSCDHATYYPNAKLMSIKLLFTPGDGRLIGAQIVGENGVDKRIDILATAIHGKMTVFDLENLELSYAPQFGSAKDPINIAGNVAANILRGDMQIIQWDEVEHLDESHVLLDVRSLDEVIQTGKIPGAIHIHIDDLRGRLGELDKTKTYIPYCTVSLRGYIAYRILIQSGFNAKVLSGGYKTWYSPVQESVEETLQLSSL